MEAFQDYYADHVAQCYGCGRLNEAGYHLRTTWDGEESVSRYTPQPFHMAVPGVVYGGLLASLIDCHSTATAAGAAYRAAGREWGSEPSFRFVTGSLMVTFLRPTPLGPELEIRGSVSEMSGRKVVVESNIRVGEEICVRAEVVAIEMPQGFS